MSTESDQVVAVDESTRKRHQRALLKKKRREGGGGGGSGGSIAPSTTGAWHRTLTETVTDRPAIIARDIHVVYKVYGERQRGKFLKRPTRDVVALAGVSLEIKRGEAFGIVGPNGAGKTTLVRVLAGTLPPNQGIVEANGRPEMLGLGAGFNRALTGRRNIYLGAMASGMRKKDVDAVVEEIIEFAELGDAIDRPVETYSSGMSSRLAFAVAVQNEPDILLVDEALSVGDDRFQQKSQQRMEKMLESAGAIVMVSHGLGRLQKFCDRMAFLNEGKIVMVDRPDKVAAVYRDYMGLGDEIPGQLEISFED